MLENVFSLFLLALLTFASAYFSGSETALFSLSGMRVKAYKDSPDHKKRLIAELLSRPRDLLVTVFMLNTLVNILLQNVASSMFGMAAGWHLKVGVPLFLTLILGEIIPKNICMQNNVPVSYHVVTSVDFFHRWLAPIRKWTIAVTHPISKLLFFYLRKEESISKEEMQHVLRTSEQHGVLHPDETRLVRGYLKLQTSTVREIMVPREDILYYEVNEPLTKLTHLFKEQECTRLPVCRGGFDHVLGVISAKQFFLHGHKARSGEDLVRLLKKPFFVPETTPAKNLMRQLDESNQVIALVVDEYGSVSGLIAKEDIQEVVIGEITDQRDAYTLFTKAGKEEIIASGKMELSEFNELFDTNLQSPANMITIGGWLIEKMGDIPKGGTTFLSDGFFFQVLSAEPNRIKRLYIRRQDPPKNPLDNL